jgi:SAM-dependent methyltransferase
MPNNELNRVYSGGGLIHEVLSSSKEIRNDMLTLNPKESSKCKVCGHSAELFDVVDFNKFCSTHNALVFGLRGEPVYYERCMRCDFVFTRHCDEWSAGKFSEEIYNSDYIKVDGEYVAIRPTGQARRFAQFFPNAKPLEILDYGSGAGVFVNELCQAGYGNAIGYDPFSSPNRPTGKFDIIVAIEVLEHSPNPLETFREILSFAKEDFTLVFTTMVQPEDICSVRARHWYIAPRNGHISFHSVSSLCFVAKIFGLEYFEKEGLKFFTRGNAPIVPGSKPLLDYKLLPPIDESRNEKWHPVEAFPHGKGRWTACDEITWEISASRESTARISLSVSTGIMQDFVHNCSISVNARRIPLVANLAMRGMTLSGNIDIPSEPCLVILRTPALVRPSEMRASTDTRPLGMFVLF